MSAPQPPKLLTLLSQIIAQDEGPSGFSGRLAIVVVTSQGNWGWLATFEARQKARAAFIATLPDVDCVWSFREEEADAILRGTPLASDAELWSDGDRSLVARFVARYLRRATLLSLRVGARTRSDD